MTGTVVTFYSYKGGVGRTFALANTAATLCRWGYRTLCIDWDLDAPGLGFYLQEWQKWTPRTGLVNLIDDYVSGLHPQPSNYAVPIELPGAQERLDFIPAGSGDEGHAKCSQHRAGQEKGKTLPTPNDKLRKARERTSSSTYHSEGLSRQELAERVNTWIWEHHHKQVALNANYIGKLEQGFIRWPGRLYREALRAVLGAPTDAALGFVNTLRAVVKLDDVKRRNLFETTTAGVGALALEEGPIAALLKGRSEPTPIPKRVSATDIAQIRAAKHVFQSWGFTYGGGLVRDVVMCQLRWSAGLLDTTCPERLRPELHSVVGDLATTAGIMALDAGAHEEARRVLGFGLYCAEQAKDWPLRAEVLSDMTERAIWTGQPDEGLTLAELALARPDRLTATILAMLHTNRASALAKMGWVQETLRAIGTADDHFAHSTPDNDPPFMAGYNASVHASRTGQRLADLAILGRDPSEATDRLTTSATGNPPGLYVRPQAIRLAKLATLTMATGDPLHAASIGHQALEVAGSIRSHIAAEGLRELSRYAAAHQDLEEVAHLRQRIATLVCPDDPDPRDLPEAES